MRHERRRHETAWALAALLLLAAGSAQAADPARKVLVLGVDGLDPVLLREFADEGLLPNFQRLMQQGDFSTLETTMPPLSPIAWSTFITGMDPGGHGIYDFIHRDPTYPIIPYLSMARTTPPERIIPLFGPWVLPMGGGVENLRKGRAFWELLDEGGVPTTIFRMPANYPPVETGGKAFSGMGTPDFRGTSGTFSFYTDRYVPNAKDMAGGKVYPVSVVDNHVGAKLWGPPNPFKREERPTYRSRQQGKMEYRHPDLGAPFDVYLDPERPVAKIVVGGTELVLRQGEWSDWVRVDFETVPTPLVVMSVGTIPGSLNAIARFYLKQVRPDFELYVTPLQINPEEPVLPISSPSSWANELYRELGHFYTQELPEDTKAVTGGIFTGHEFWDQSQFVYRERRRALDYFLERFQEGFLFFYFSSIDQGCHMMWHYADSGHPGYQHDEQLAAGIRTLYQELDEALGRTMEFVDDDTTLIVMSDHGFSPFNRGVNLNTWLLEKGYVKLVDPSKQGRLPMFANVDWSETKAYALGLNGLYVNLRGREERGIVPQAEYETLLAQLERDLLELQDPENGAQAVTLVVRTKRDFHGAQLDGGPDIIVGYNRGYRSSWDSPLGEFPEEIFVDNDEAWSGDHAMDYRHVPGVLLTNRRITMDKPALYDLTVAILDEYGIGKPAEMLGQDCLASPGTAAAP